MEHAQSFSFERFTLDIEGGAIEYVYRSDAGHVFEHRLTFDFPPGSSDESLASAAFALGMAELVHYWKALLTPQIVVRAGKLTADQITFWETLYTKGLGEFFYVNQIDFRGLVRIVSDPDAPEIPLPAPHTHPTSHALVPFGGGKDSIVTGELLKQQGKAFSWFELEPLSFAGKLKDVSPTQKSITMGRDVATNFAPVMELVARGAPNGHVPITATYIMSAVFAAKAHGFQDVVLSLERSANEGNVEYLGMTVNHQYSKTFEFEQAIHTYIQTHVDPSIRAFSLLRPWYELRIVQEFATHPQYFPYFVSCNRGLRSGTWCGTCAKCAFMFAALSAFLPPATVIDIFKKDLFSDESLLPLYRALIGLGENKPFDCVGTFEENLLALYLAAGQYTSRSVPIPPVLAALPYGDGEKYESLLESRGEHLIPEGYHTP